MPAVGSLGQTSDVPGEAVYRNVTGTLDQPNTLRFGYSVIKDIYQNSPIDAAAGQRRDGISLLTQLNEVWVVDDAADSAAALYLPASAHMIVKLPIDALVTSGVVGAFIRRLHGAYFTAADSTSAEAIAPLLVGVTSIHG
jgi:hypothetical protein